MDLPIRDEAAALKLAGNQRELADTLFGMFVAQLPDALAQINEALTLADYPALQAAVHKLHGAASYCGLPRLLQALKALESHLKTNIMTDSVQALCNALQVEANHILQAYQKTQ